jgi:hypothetical protein
MNTKRLSLTAKSLSTKVSGLLLAIDKPVFEPKNVQNFSGNSFMERNVCTWNKDKLENHTFFYRRLNELHPSRLRAS